MSPAAGAAADARTARRTTRALARRERVRRLAAWAQLGWMPGLLGLVGVTVAGVVAGGPSHRGMPMAWTPLVSVFTGMLVGGVGIAVVATAVRGLAAASLRLLARRPEVARLLAEAAREPLAAGDGLGRWRIAATHPLVAVPVLPPGLRIAARASAAIAGLGLLVASSLALPSMAAGRGGGLDLLVATLTGLVLLALAARRGPRPWSAADAADAAAAAAGRSAPEARVLALGGPPGRRRLAVRPAGDHGPVLVLADLPGWPASAVLRHRLAAVLPDPLATAVRGDAAGGAVPGDPALPVPRPHSPPAAPAAQSPPSASSAASTDSGSVRGS